MDLKEYQERALERFGRWIEVLNEERRKSDELVQESADINARDHAVRDAGNYPKHAWEEMADKSEVAERAHRDRPDRAGRPIPHACLKIPTGGGKTLVAAAALERLGMRAGLVLWVVPTRRIYAQTLEALRNRNHPVRQRLNRGSGGRIKILEKGEPFSAHDTEQHLCVMLLMLAATNRSKNSDFLLINQDSEAYLSFFPDSDDTPGNARLMEENPGLEVEDGTVRRSLANVIRMKRPVVILDEAHKAYSNHKRGREYSGMINNLNPGLVVEMSATPNPLISNMLVDVSGTDLWREEMIKMPIYLNVQTDSDWKHMLDVVHAKRNELEEDAQSLQSGTGRYVRPIAVVRVERTGKNQRGGDHIHADDVREYLESGLRVQPDHIAVQSFEKPELDNVELASETTPIRWIITKDALREGWDCPFAYVLAVLDNIATHTSVTQLLGRVLRQPGPSRTGVDGLDRCYVYCHRSDTGDVADHVRRGLGEIGMADMARAIMPADHGGTAQTVRKRKKGQRGRVFLPLVLHRKGRGWRELKYERDILSGVDFGVVCAPDPSNFGANPHGWERWAVTPDGGSETEPEWRAHGAKSPSMTDLALSLSNVVPNVWQAARIVRDFMGRLRDSGRTESDIYDGLPYLRKVLRDHVAESVNAQAEAIFRDKLECGDIRFDLEIEGHGYLVEDYDVREGSLLKRGGRPVQRTLFDPVYEEEFDNDMECNFARYLDAKGIVKWWHRVAATQSGGYRLSGWNRHDFYPDFVVMTNEAGDRARLGIYDTKGDHLADSRDTKYKEDLLKALEGAFDCGTVRVRGGRIRGEFRMVFEGRFEEILAGSGEGAVNAL